MLAALLAAYAALFVRLPQLGESNAFDPLDVRGRQVERDIEVGRFGDALPIARDLARAHPGDPVIAYWLAEIHRGLGHRDDEADAWERVFELTRSAEAACPGLPESYAASGKAVQALNAYERCASAGQGNAERWLDLALAYRSAGRTQDAERAIAKSRELDPSNPRLPYEEPPPHPHRPSETK
jgi:Flp pilus assembly protein TadD